MEDNWVPTGVVKAAETHLRFEIGSTPFIKKGEIEPAETHFVVPIYYRPREYNEETEGVDFGDSVQVGEMRVDTLNQEVESTSLEEICERISEADSNC